MTLYKHEMKMNRKGLFLWTLCVGFICLGCILLYTSLEDSVKDIADSFSDMGSISTALGMDKMSLATLRGYYATEIAMMHNLLAPYSQRYWEPDFYPRKRPDILLLFQCC